MCFHAVFLHKLSSGVDDSLRRYVKRSDLYVGCKSRVNSTQFMDDDDDDDW